MKHLERLLRKHYVGERLREVPFDWQRTAQQIVAELLLVHQPTRGQDATQHGAGGSSGGTPEWERVGIAANDAFQLVKTRIAVHWHAHRKAGALDEAIAAHTTRKVYDGGDACALAKLPGMVQKLQHTVEAGFARVDDVMLATQRLVSVLALGELDCPRYVFIVPDTWHGDGLAGAKAKVVHRLHSLHAKQLRLLLVCERTFQPVKCGKDGFGYPIMVEKDWVKNLYKSLAPVLKISLLTAKGVMMASGAGIAVPFVSKFLPKLGDLDVDGAKLGEAFAEQIQEEHLAKQREGIDSMLEKIDQQVEGLGSKVEESKELNRTLASAGGASDGGAAAAASKELKEWTGASYRYLLALLKEQDPLLQHLGVEKAVNESTGVVEWVSLERRDTGAGVAATPDGGGAGQRQWPGAGGTSVPVGGGAGSEQCVAEHGVSFAGTLIKKGSSFPHSWRQRFCKLRKTQRGAELTYYARESDATARGTFSFDAFTDVPPRGGKFRPNRIDIHSRGGHTAEVLAVGALTAADKVAWLAQLSAVAEALPLSEHERFKLASSSYRKTSEK
jgi:hypothetical protein